uniref:Uncharacterized protein n=1 Tax=Parascaris univalens TaxID=6257 RepID=A0A915C9I6_PARUN
MDWTERMFLPVPYCNTYSLHQIVGAPGSGVMCVTLFGGIYWLDEKNSTNLSRLIDEKLDEGASAEVVASDCAAHPDSDILAIFATCWVIYEKHCMPIRYFAALFKISTDLSFTLEYKFELLNPPTFTRITAESAITGNRYCWLIFTASRAARLFLVKASSITVEEVDSIGDIYPGLDLGDLPGSAVRSCCLQTSSYRWSVLGFDTGYVIVTSLSLKTNFIVDRTKLKFSGAISVLQLLRLEGREDKMLVLISSTLGPAAVWSLAMSADKSHFEWKRISVLNETRGHDTIVCSTASEYYIAIAAYDGLILVYRREDLLSEEAIVRSCSLIEHPAPAIAMKFLDDDQLAVLSTSGLHLIVPLHTPTSSVFTDDECKSSMMNTQI